MSGEGLELDGRIAEAGLYGPTEWDRLRAKASAEAHQGGRRALVVRLWLDELKAMPQIALEAKKLDPEGLEALRADLKAFPKALFDHYEADFALFSNNLFYHQIPAEKLRQYMAGMARYELGPLRAALGHQGPRSQAQPGEALRLLRHAARQDEV